MKEIKLCKTLKMLKGTCITLFFERYFRIIAGFVAPFRKHQSTHCVYQYLTDIWWKQDDIWWHGWDAALLLLPCWSCSFLAGCAMNLPGPKIAWPQQAVTIMLMGAEERVGNSPPFPETLPPWGQRCDFCDFVEIDATSGLLQRSKVFSRVPGSLQKLCTSE